MARTIQTLRLAFAVFISFFPIVIATETGLRSTPPDICSSHGCRFCIAFHGLAVHGSPGNASANRRRRALSTRWLGDDITCREHPRVAKPIGDPGLKPGDSMDCDLFQAVWRTAAATADVALANPS
jgi:hypothetical protein